LPRATADDDDAGHGSTTAATPDPFGIYGTDARSAKVGTSTPGWNEPLDSRLPCVGGQVVWAARHEMARTVEDVLGRRLRALFLDAEAAIARSTRGPAGLSYGDAAWQADQLTQLRRSPTPIDRFLSLGGFAMQSATLLKHRYGFE
jgi:glycerol-3-phosphate dehydrogenase